MYSGTNYIRPEKRVDLTKILVYTKKDIDLDQLKKDIEEEIVPELDRKKDYQSEVYFVKVVKESLSKGAQDEIRNEGWDKANAIVVRGKANSDNFGVRNIHTRNILTEGLEKIRDRYQGKMKWTFKYADELKTREIMNYNQNPAKKERMT